MKNTIQTTQQQLIQNLQQFQNLNSQIVGEQKVSSTKETEIKKTMSKIEQVTTQFVETAASSSSSSSKQETAASQQSQKQTMASSKKETAASSQQQTQQQTPQQTQQQTQPQQRPSQQPPQLERIEPGSDTPATTIPPKERTRIKEKRDNRGQVTEVEVQSGPSRYTRKPNTQVGTALPGDAMSSQRGPQWTVKEFDFGNPKKQDTANQPVSPAPAKPGVPARADVPPPPPLEPVEKK